MQRELPSSVVWSLQWLDGPSQTAAALKPPPAFFFQVPDQSSRLPQQAPATNARHRRLPPLLPAAQDDCGAGAQGQGDPHPGRGAGAHIWHRLPACAARAQHLHTAQGWVHPCTVCVRAPRVPLQPGAGLPAVAGHACCTGRRAAERPRNQAGMLCTPAVQGGGATTTRFSFLGFYYIKTLKPLFTKKIENPNKPCRGGGL